MLRLHRPIVIVDEAHNARTPLSFKMLARFSPSLIVEFTATPEMRHRPSAGHHASNLLTHVSAHELKAEEMIKLPIRLETNPDWRETLAAAVGRQQALERLAMLEEQAGGEPIRPIVLLQAEANRAGQDSLTFEVLRQALIEDFRILEEQVRVATGNRRELEGLDLNARDCPVRYVITVQALKEGWDCPFAYVLCSVAPSRSERAVEQLLGRVLRMPYARRRQHGDLNQAYAYATSSEFAVVAQRLRDALVENGFERLEAQALVAAAEERQRCCRRWKTDPVAD